MNNIYDTVLKRAGVDFGEVRDGRRSPLFHYDVDLSVARSLAAGTAEVLGIAADAFYSDKDPLQGTATVHFQDTTLTGNSSAPVYVEPGFITKTPFTKLLIENEAQPGKRLRIIYAVGADFVPGTASDITISGYVVARDYMESLAASGDSYASFHQVLASGAAYSYVELWNPVGSGKNLLVTGVQFYNAVAVQRVVLLRNNSGAAFTAGTARINRRVGGNASSGLLGGIQSATVPAFAADSYDNFITQVNVNFFKSFRDFPFVLPPGKGLFMVPDVVNVSNNASFEWAEVSSV